MRMKGGQSREMGSRESHTNGEEERRDGVASARTGWKGGVRVERSFLRTKSRWPRAMETDWGGLRRKILLEAADFDISAADGIEYTSR
jgi:hypothetical protein